MEVVKGGDQRQYFAPCLCPLKSITVAEVKSAPGQSGRPPLQLPIHTHTPLSTSLAMSQGPYGANTHISTHCTCWALQLPAVKSTCSALFVQCVCVGVCAWVCVCIEEQRVQQSYKLKLGKEKDNYVGPSRTCTLSKCQK